MKIGLMGLPFADGNLGCVALTCSMIAVLQKMFDDLTIVRLEQDELPEKITKEFDGVEFLYRKIKIKDYSLSTIKAFKECDYIIDGTFGDNFSDIYSKRFVTKTTLFKEMAILSGTPLILAPQTYGPFKDKNLERFAAHVINKCRYVYSRDKMSSEYVEGISKIKPDTVTDLAFLLPYKKVDQEKRNNTIHVGVGVSGLLYRQGFNNNAQFSSISVSYQEYIHKLISELQQQNQYAIHLIPHVIANEYSTIDDDWEQCVHLNKKYSNTVLAPRFETPMEAKSYIAGLDFFTGARMHSTIAAFSTGVPTIPFAYSRKFQGLYSTFGYNKIIDGSVLSTDAAVDKTIEYVEKRNSIKQEIEPCLKNIKEKLELFQNSLSDVLQ